jgi:D-glycero-D-manno-heptose 1,7-bisphosphate phosphatase
MTASGIFMDRDGTLIEEAHYLADPERVKLLPGVVEGLRRLREQGKTLLVATNQSGIARGLYSLEAMHRVNERLEQILRERGVGLDRVYFCPHHPQGSIPELTRECDCRKPGTGMLEQGLREFGLLAAESWMIGDKLADIESGRRLGMHTILVLTGYGQKTQIELKNSEIKPAYIAADFSAAVDFILRRA